MRTIEWVDGRVRLIDQTKLPHELVQRDCSTPEEVAEAIKQLQVRGAPAIGIAGALGVVLAAKAAEEEGVAAVRGAIEKAGDLFLSTRPTAVNLQWAIERMRREASAALDVGPGELTDKLLTEALEIIREDDAVCRAIGENGESFVPDGTTVLTHCNAGGLATASYGTALAIVFEAHRKGKKISVLADETRPLLQGARLTTWELLQREIPVTLLCDGMAAWAMKQGKVDVVITGADRITANGDVANKIGTYSLAIAAARHGIPFVVAAPMSTVDPALASGDEIPIEHRGAEEVSSIMGRRIAPEEVQVYNPAFDVTPAALVSAIVTELGVARPPLADSLGEMIASSNRGECRGGHIREGFSRRNSPPRT